MKTMFKLFFIIFVTLIINSCASQKGLSFYEDNDSYVNIKQERKKKAEMLAQQKKQQEERQKYIQDSIAKELEKADRNPYYKEPNYSKDDYYDYEYAARIKRFYNPISGLGYYDDWYTNYGFYNNTNYGTSIYMGYGNYYPSMGIWQGWGNPYFSYGIGTCWGNPIYFGAPYAFSPWGYYPYYGGYGVYMPYIYNPYYPYSYYYGYYYPYYYNTQDVNSMTYAPRTSYEGFYSQRTANNINLAENKISNPRIVYPQINITKFDETARPKPVGKLEPSQVNVISSSLIRQINNNSNIQTNLMSRDNNANINGINTTGQVIIAPKNGILPRKSNEITSTPVLVKGSLKEVNINTTDNSIQKALGDGNNSSGFSTPTRRSGSSGNTGRPR